MRFISNMLWALIFGVPYLILFFVLGVACCLTIVLIPFGIQFFKLMKVSLRPRKYYVEIDPSSHFVLNLIWGLMIGLALAFVHLVFGIVCCLTLIGIPFGIKCFKLMKLSYAPFGATVDTNRYN